MLCGARVLFIRWSFLSLFISRIVYKKTSHVLTSWIQSLISSTICKASLFTLRQFIPVSAGWKPRAAVGWIGSQGPRRPSQGHTGSDKLRPVSGFHRVPGPCFEGRSVREGGAVYFKHPQGLVFNCYLLLYFSSYAPAVLRCGWAPSLAWGCSRSFLALVLNTVPARGSRAGVNPGLGFQGVEVWGWHWSRGWMCLGVPRAGNETQSCWVSVYTPYERLILKTILLIWY